MAFNYSGMEELFGQVQALQKHHEKFIRDFLMEMGMRCLAETKRRTPVDTNELRKNWELSDVFMQGNNLCIEIYNNTDYASYVEHGHRKRNDEWWEGYHMAKVSIDKINAELPARYDKAFQQFMAGIGG